MLFRSILSSAELPPSWQWAGGGLVNESGEEEWRLTGVVEGCAEENRGEGLMGRRGGVVERHSVWVGGWMR